MELLVKYKFDKKESKAFKGRCIPANSLHALSFDQDEEYTVSGDEYLVKKVIELAKEAGAKTKQGKVEKAKEDK